MIEALFNCTVNGDFQMGYSELPRSETFRRIHGAISTCPVPGPPLLGLGHQLRKASWLRRPLPTTLQPRSGLNVEFWLYLDM